MLIRQKHSLSYYNVKSKYKTICPKTLQSQNVKKLLYYNNSNISELLYNIIFICLIKFL